MRAGCVVATLATLALASLAGGQDAGSWQPPEPAPDRSDWVQLTSGEWLKGRIIDLYDEKLAFESDELDLRVIDWEDVRRLRSAGPMKVSFDGGAVVTGTIDIDAQVVRLSGEPGREIPRATVVTIARGGSGEKARWSAKAAVGANLRGGNTKQGEFTGTASLVRRDVKDRLTLDMLGTFNRTEGTIIADDQRATAGWGHLVTKGVAWAPLFVEWLRDPFGNVGQRWTLGTGLVFELVRTPRTTGKASVGVAYQSTRFVAVEPGDASRVETPALVVMLTWEHELTRRIDLDLDHRFHVVNAVSGAYTHHLVSSLEVEMTSLLSLDLMFTWDRTQRPTPDASGTVPKRDDVRLGMLLSLDF